MDYYIAYEQVRVLSFEAFKERLMECNGLALGDCRLSDLCLGGHSQHGLYLMFSSTGSLAYIGKATSRSFIERIPAHLDRRENGWMNTVPKHIMRIWRLATFADAHQAALGLRLVLLGFEDPGVAKRLEGPLISFLRPQLNRGGGRVDGSRQLSTFEAQRGAAA